jgi:hypothetical protein
MFSLLSGTTQNYITQNTGFYSGDMYINMPGYFFLYFLLLFFFFLFFFYIFLCFLFSFFFFLLVLFFVFLFFCYVVLCFECAKRAFSAAPISEDLVLDSSRFRPLASLFFLLFFGFFVFVFNFFFLV